MKVSVILLLALVAVAHVCAQDPAADPAAAPPADAGAAPAADPSAAAPAADAGAAPAADPSAAAAAAPAATPAPAAAPAATSAAAPAAAPTLNPASAGEASAAVADPLNLGATDNLLRDASAANNLPPFTSMDADTIVSPNLGVTAHTSLNLDIDRRIKQTEDLINRMTWQLNRETAWANAVHDIIQNYQYKYTKVLSSIKQHTSTMDKMRELAQQLKKARLHEILEADLAKAQSELDELKIGAAEGSESADGKSYGALVDRVALIKADLEKMADKKVHAAVHNVEKQVKETATSTLPPPSDDTLAGLLGESSKKASL